MRIRNPDPGGGWRPVKGLCAEFLVRVRIQMRIRIGSIYNRVSGSGFRIRIQVGHKPIRVPKKRGKLKKCPVSRVIWRTRSFSWRLDVLCGFLLFYYITLLVSIEKFLKFSFRKTWVWIGNGIQKNTWIRIRIHVTRDSKHRLYVKIAAFFVISNATTYRTRKWYKKYFKSA